SRFQGVDGVENRHIAQLVDRDKCRTVFRCHDTPVVFCEIVIRIDGCCGVEVDFLLGDEVADTVQSRFGTLEGGWCRLDTNENMAHFHLFTTTVQYLQEVKAILCFKNRRDLAFFKTESLRSKLFYPVFTCVIPQFTTKWCRAIFGVKPSDRCEVRSIEDLLTVAFSLFTKLIFFFLR